MVILSKKFKRSFRSLFGCFGNKEVDAIKHTANSATLPRQQLNNDSVSPQSVMAPTDSITLSTFSSDSLLQMLGSLSVSQSKTIKSNQIQPEQQVSRLQNVIHQAPQTTDHDIQNLLLPVQQTSDENHASICTGSMNSDKPSKNLTFHPRNLSSEYRQAAYLGDLLWWPNNAPLLPPQKIPERKCLVIDLDETLIHSSFHIAVSSADFVIDLELGQGIEKVYVQKRPGVDEFLEAVSEVYEVVIFTASLPSYANAVINLLDPERKRISHRLFRDSCVYYRGQYIKDLTLLGRSLHEIIIIDNSPVSYLFQPDHAVPIPSWYSDITDKHLKNIQDPLVSLAIMDEPLSSLHTVKNALSRHFVNTTDNTNSRYTLTSKSPNNVSFDDTNNNESLPEAVVSTISAEG